MPPNWLSKLNEAAHDVSESLVDQVSEHLEGHEELLGPLLGRVSDCRVAASETVEICTSTGEKREQMIAFGRDIQNTFQTLQEGGDASQILETIRHLTDGEKVRAAQELARGLDEAALSCVHKATHMLDLMENGLNSIPSVVRNGLESKSEDSKESDLVRSLESDFKDVKDCVDAIQNLKLATAVTIGMQAFTQLTSTSEKCRSMFDSINEFATDVVEITTALSEMNVATLAAKAKDMLRCVHQIKIMRAIAEGAGKLLEILIDLFEVTAEKISSVWAAIAQAKDCLMASLASIVDAKKQCLDAGAKGSLLIEKCGFVQNQLDGVGDMNVKSVQALKELAQGDDIKAAIDLARSMDDLILDCSSKVIAMVSEVSGSFEKLPAILTTGIDIVEEGKRDDDPKPKDVQADIDDLEASSRAIEQSNIVTAVKAGASAISGASSKVVICQEMIGRMSDFTGGCELTIDGFTKEWDLQRSVSKITELFRLVTLGQIIKQLAEQINKLVAAIVTLMQAVIAKFSAGFGDVAEDLVEGAMDMMKDKFSFLK